MGEEHPQGDKEEHDGEFSPRHRLLRQRTVAFEAMAAVFGQLAAIGTPEDADSFHAQTPFGRIRPSSLAFDLDGKVSLTHSSERS